MGTSAKLKDIIGAHCCKTNWKIIKVKLKLFLYGNYGGHAVTATTSMPQMALKWASK